MSQSFNKLPSELLFVEREIDAFALNRAVWLFGSTVDGKMEAVEGKNAKEIRKKRLKVLQKYVPQAADASGFADPAKREQ